MESNDKARPSQNPEGDAAGSDAIEPAERHGVSGDEAERAGGQATADEPVDRDEIHDQSAYKDDSADAGQQAADAEKHRREE